MKNKLFYHLLIDVGLSIGIIFLNEKRKERNEIKKVNKKLEEVKSAFQNIEIDVEIIGENVKETKKYLTSSTTKAIVG